MTPFINRLQIAFVCLLLAGSVSLASAQAPAQPPATPQAPPIDPAEGGSTAEPVRIGPLTLSGHAWLESIFATGDDPNNPVDMFRIRRARFSLAGNAAPKIGWNLGADFSASPSLRAVFVLFRPLQQLNIRFGQATPPTGIERGTNPLVSEFLERSRPTMLLTYPLDIGITLMNERPYRGWVGYTFAVVNGSGFNRPDDNRAKDIVGRVRITPPPLRGVMINMSAGTGEQPAGRRTRANLGAQYEIPRFKIAVEGFRQTIGDSPVTDAMLVFGAVRVRPETPHQNFHMLEISGRFWVMNDPVTGIPPPPDEDGGSAPPDAALPVTTREAAIGVNYDLNQNVRLMGNVSVPIDDRDSSVVYQTRLQLVF